MLFSKKKKAQTTKFDSPIQIIFNTEKLYNAIEEKKSTLGLSWAGVTSQLNLSFNLDKKLLTNSGLVEKFDEVLVLIDWLDKDFVDFLEEQNTLFHNIDLSDI